MAEKKTTADIQEENEWARKYLVAQDQKEYVDKQGEGVMQPDTIDVDLDAATKSIKTKLDNISKKLFGEPIKVERVRGEQEEQPEQTQVLNDFSDIVHAINNCRHCGVDKQLIKLLNSVKRNGLGVLDNLIYKTESANIAAKLKHLLRVQFDKGLEFKIVMGGIIELVDKLEDEKDKIDEVKKALGADLYSAAKGQEEVVVVSDDEIAHAFSKQQDIGTAIFKMIAVVENGIAKDSNYEDRRQKIGETLSCSFSGMNRSLWGVIVERCLESIQSHLNTGKERQIVSKMREELGRLLDQNLIQFDRSIEISIDRMVREIEYGEEITPAKNSEQSESQKEKAEILWLMNNLGHAFEKNYKPGMRFDDLEFFEDNSYSEAELELVGKLDEFEDKRVLLEYLHEKCLQFRNYKNLKELVMFKVFESFATLDDLSSYKEIEEHIAFGVEGAFESVPLHIINKLSEVLAEFSQEIYELPQLSPLYGADERNNIISDLCKDLAASYNVLGNKLRPELLGLSGKQQPVDSWKKYWTSYLSDRLLTLNEVTLDTLEKSLGKVDLETIGESIKSQKN